MSKGKHIKGAGGGSSSGSSGSRTPVVDPDSIQSRAILSILDLLGEGQIKGLVNGDQSIFINNTALGNADGSKNFEGVTWDFRDGRQDQDPIAGFPTVSTPFNVGIQVKNATPYTLTVSDNDSDFVKVVVTIPALYSQDVNSGDIHGTAVEYQFTISNNNGPFVPVNIAGTTEGRVRIDDKSRSKYQREHSIPLPKPGSNYRIRMTRITADSTSSYLANDTYIDSYYEILDNKLSYPNSVMCGIRINAEQLAENPSRSYLVDGLYVQVPTNYDPETRLYTGVWDGSFKIGYTNNPAWILRDLLLNKRYGLGEFVSPSQVNSAKLYTIARYCDGMVDDGAGGQEPRFTINTVIAARRDAYKVVQDICSVFRGMSYWAAGAIQVTQDSPSDPQFLFTNANVVDGTFNRMSSARKDRHSVVHVQWNDPLDQYKQKIEYVEDKDLINKIGYRKTDTIAFGCTSRAQAHRVGLWILYTEAFETNVMTFEVGLEGVQCVPGDIVKVHDQYRAGKRVGGRLKASTTVGCTLDSTVQISTGSRISIKMPDGKFEEVAINEVGPQSVITFASPLSAVPKANATWIISEPNLVPELVRCVGVSQSETAGQFVISVVDHNPSKFASIEQGLNLEKLPTTILDPTTSAPETLKIEEFTYLVAPGQLGTKLIASWEGKSVQYFVSWRMNSGSGSSAWVQETTSKPTFELLNVTPNAIYDFKVVGQSLTGKLSAELVGTYTTLGTMTPPKPPTDLTAVGDFRQIILNWVNSGDVDFDYVEIYENTVDDVETAYYLDRTPSNTYTRTGIPGLMKYWYWVRTVNKRGMASAFNSTAGTSAIAGLISKTDLEEELAQPIEDITDIKNTQEQIQQALTDAQEAITDIDSQVDQVKTDLTGLQTDLTTQLSTINGTISGIQTQVTNNKTAVDTAIGQVNTSIGQINTEITGIKSTATALQTQVTNNKTAAETTASSLQTQITNNLTAVNAQVANLQSQITNAVDANQYNKALAYTVGQFAYIGNSLYQAKIAVPAKADGTNAPPNATYWRDAGTVISSADGLAARVTANETSIGTINGTLTSQASTITGIQTTLNGKADASALTALETRVTSAEGVNTSQGTAITNLTNSLAGKADASAVTALTTRVTAAEGLITSQGNSLTSVQATLGNIAGNGSNLIPSQWSWLTSTTLPSVVVNTGASAVAVAVAEALSGFGYKFTSSSTSTGLFLMLTASNNAAGYNVQVEPGTYLVSFYASAPATASIRANLYDGTSRYSSTVALTTTRTRYTMPITVAASAKIGVTLYPNMSGLSGTEVTIDSVMLEKRIGENNTASPFASGPTASAVTGLATATTALEARVTAAEGVNTSQATSITNLNTSLAGKADASALTALTTRVTAAEGVNTSQGDSITSLTNSLAGKADASALTALTTRVTTAEGTIASQGSALTSLTNTVAGKADASALTALTTRVTTAEGNISSNSGALTEIKSVLGQQPDNLILKGIFEDGDIGPWTASPTITNLTAHPSYSKAITFYSNSFCGTTFNVTTRGGEEFDCSADVWNNYMTAGQTARLQLQFYDKTNTNLGYFTAFTVNAGTNGFVTYTGRITAPVGAVTARFVIRHETSDGSGRSLWCNIVARRVTAADSANAAATTALTTRVTAAEGTITSQGTAITNLTNTVNGKADASALTALTTRVTTAEGTISSQGSAITNLTNTVNGKADASALTALTTRVTTAEGLITSQGNSITSLTNSLAGKADVSALNALTTRVTAAEGTITSQGNSLTSVQATLNNIAGAGVNLLSSEYSWLASTTLPAVNSSLSNRSGVAVAESASGFGYYVQATNNSLFSYLVLAAFNSPAYYNLYLEAGTYLVSMYVKGDTAGQVMANLYDGTNSRSQTLNYTTDRQRLTFVITLPATAKSVLLIYPNRQGANPPVGITIDSIMIEKRVGENNTPSPFVAGAAGGQMAGMASATTALEARVTAAEGVNTSQSTSITNLTNSLANKADASALTSLTTRVTTAEGTISSQGTAITNLTNTVNGKADASALNALTTRVTTAEGNITSQGNSITSLTNSLAGKADVSALNALTTRVTTAEGNITSQATATTNLQTTIANMGGAGTNLVPDAYSWLTSTTLPTTTMSVGSTLVGVAVAGSASGFGYKYTSPSTNTGVYFMMSPTNNAAGYNVPVEPGTYILSYYASSPSTASLRVNLFDGASKVGGTFPLTTTRTRYATLITITAATKIAVTAYPNMAGIAGTEVTIDSVMLEKALNGVTVATPSSFTAGPSAATAASQASAISSLDTRLTAAEGVNTSQSTSITNLTNSLSGKADASALTALTTRVTTAEGLITSQGNSITSLNNTVAGKADTSALNALTTRVTTAEGNISSQGSSLTTLTSMIGQQPDNLVLKGTFEDGDIGPWTANPTISSVTHPTYSKAITFMANSFCGTTRQIITAPGEMFDCSADIYNNEMSAGQNTRLQIQFYDKNVVNLGYFNAFTCAAGSAGWQSFSGRITAPAGAVTARFVIRHEVADSTGKSHWCNIVCRRVSAADTANAAATSALTTRVTAAEGTITSQGTSITNLTNSLAGKADASALTALTTRVTAAEGTLTSQGTSITNLNNSLAGKADTSALNALTTRVTTAEGNITSQGSSITNLQSTIGNSGANGSNLLIDTYSWLTSTTLPATVLNGTSAIGIAVAAASSGFGYRATSTSTSTACYMMLCPSNNAAGYNIPLEAGTYLVSFYASAPATATVRVSLFDGTQRYTPTFTMTTGRARYAGTVTVTAATKVTALFYYNMSAISGTQVTIDSVMIEKMNSGATAATPSSFVPGPSAAALSATAAALSSLTTTVTQQGSTLTALSTQVNTLQTDLGNTSAAVSTTSTALATLDGKLSASWTAKVQLSSDGTRYFAGMGIGIQQTDQGITQSQIAFQADRIVMINPSNSNAIAPFQVVGGIVYLNSAVIQTSAITNAMIADAQITAGKIAQATIVTAHIVDGNITTAKIGALQVDTLRIAGRAVTIPSLAFTNDLQYLTGATANGAFNWTSIQSLAVYVDETSFAQVNISFGQCGQNGSFVGVGAWRLLMNGTIIASGDGVQQFGSTACTIAVTAPVGTTTYDLQVTPHAGSGTYSYGMVVQCRAISFMAVKR